MKIGKVLLIAIWLFACGLFGYFSPTLPFIKNILGIKHVYVEGTDKLTEKDIKEIFKDQTWLFVDEDIIKDRVKKYGFVKDINIEKIKFGDLKLKIVESKPIAILDFKSEKYLIDENGNILNPKYYKNYSNLPIIDYQDENFDKNKLKYLGILNNYFKDLKSIIIYRSQIVVNWEDKILVFGADNLEEDLEKAKLFFSKANINNYKYINFSFDKIVIARR